MNNVLIVFAKYPIPGQVKTRLARSLGEETAAKVYAEFVRTILERVRRLPTVGHLAFAVGQPDCVERFERDFPGADAYIAQDSSPDLGVRMRQAFAWAQQLGSRRTVIIGTDSPSLPVDWIGDAFHRLDRFEVVLGPAEDGGYYLIGAQQAYPELFANIPWSTGDVYRCSLQALIRNGRSYSSLPTFFDVDEPADLERLQREAPEIYRRLPLPQNGQFAEAG